MELGERIRAIRHSRGLSQEEVARRAGLSLKGMAFIERGRITDPHYKSLVGIARALEVPVAEILEEQPLWGVVAPPESTEGALERREEPEALSDMDEDERELLLEWFLGEVGERFARVGFEVEDPMTTVAYASIVLDAARAFFPSHEPSEVVEAAMRRFGWRAPEDGREAER